MIRMAGGTSDCELMKAGGEKKAVDKLVCAGRDMMLKWLGIRKVVAQTPSPPLLHLLRYHSPLRILDPQSPEYFWSSV
jgi:hypothetical protein